MFYCIEFNVQGHHPREPEAERVPEQFRDRSASRLYHTTLTGILSIYLSIYLSTYLSIKYVLCVLKENKFTSYPPDQII